VGEDVDVLILPLIDLLILVGTGCLGVGFVLKALDITTHYHPSILGFSSMDFVLLTGVCWGFALTLAARCWVKVNEPLLQQRRRELALAQARRRVEEYELVNGPGGEEAEEIVPDLASSESR
jgi:hypothetical protein